MRTPDDSSILNIGSIKSFHLHLVSSSHVSQVRLTTVRGPSGRISIHCTLDWGRHREWSFAPFTVLDVANPSYWDALLPVFVEVMADRVACVAFPTQRGSTLDDPGNDTMPVSLEEDLSKAVDREKDLLDAMPLPGTPG